MEITMDFEMKRMVSFYLLKIVLSELVSFSSLSLLCTLFHDSIDRILPYISDCLIFFLNMAA